MGILKATTLPTPVVEMDHGALLRVYDPTHYRIGRVIVLQRSELQALSVYDQKWWVVCTQCMRMWERIYMQLRYLPPPVPGRKCACPKDDNTMRLGPQMSHRHNPATADFTVVRVLATQREIKLYSNIDDRCYRKRAKEACYKEVGATVSEAWRNSFATFLADIRALPGHDGNVPAGMTLGRIDGTKPYEAGNVRFETRQEQCDNLRCNRPRVIFNGQVWTMKHLGRTYRVPYDTLCLRIDRGWTIEQALLTPLRLRTPSPEIEPLPPKRRSLPSLMAVSVTAMATAIVLTMRPELAPEFLAPRRRSIVGIA